MSFTKEDFKDRILEMISEKEWNASNSELIDFNIKIALRAMPLIAAKLDFNASEENKLQELLYFIFNKIDWIIISKDNYKLLGIKNYSYNNYNSIMRSKLLSFELKDEKDSFQFHEIFLYMPIFDPQYFIVKKELVWSQNEPFYKTILAVEEILGIEKANKLLQVSLTEIGLLNEPGTFGYSDYGEIWDAFLKLLSENGCKYWADFYERIFKNNFVLTDEDINEIQVRVNLSKILFSPYFDNNFKHCPNKKVSKQCCSPNVEFFEI